MPNTTTLEYILGADGSVHRETRSRVELDVSQNIMEQFSKNTAFKIPNVSQFKDLGVIGLCTVAGSTYWTLSLRRLYIRAPWKVITDKQYMVPVFNSSSDPVMTMEWSPPVGCFLKLVMRSMTYADKNKPVCMNGVWFCAVDDKGTMYRLPLPNVHDDASVCTGHNESYHPTIMLGLDHVIDTFCQSRYNADLWRNVEYTQAFFRMKPEGTGFTTVPLDGLAQAWIPYCQKISNAIQSYIV